MNAETLKPCPFCGGEADIDHDHTVEENHSYGCRKCGMWFDTFNSDDAVSAWNTRAAEDVIKLKEALEYCIEEMIGAHSMIEGHFTNSEIELDQSIADAHAGLHVAIHAARTAISVGQQKEK